MRYQLDNGTLTIWLEGHIDSANAPGTEQELTRIREQNPASAIVLDCEKLAYISSAGLRVILRTKKAVPDTRLINVSAEIYETFDMTGFTEMMEIQKAYRVISIDGCEVIGQGANGRVYRLGPEMVVKVYLKPDALEAIRRERELARTAFILGVPTAIPYDVVRVEGGGYGSVFELLNATNFAKLVLRGQKTIDEVAQMSIDLLRVIHNTEVKPGVLPSMKETALDWVEFLAPYLEASIYAKLHAMVEAIPEDNHMLHGDYHLRNITRQGEENLILDMDTLSHGHPVFELASMFNAYKGFSELDHLVSPGFLGISAEQAEKLWQKSLQLYLNTEDPERIQSVEKKAMIIGYARLLRRRIRRNGFDTEAGRNEIVYYRKRLEELVPQVDSLYF